MSVPKGEAITHSSVPQPLLGGARLERGTAWEPVRAPGVQNLKERGQEASSDIRSKAGRVRNDLIEQAKSKISSKPAERTVSALRDCLKLDHMAGLLTTESVKFTFCKLRSTSKDPKIC
jgi:hypothetical protein